MWVENVTYCTFLDGLKYIVLLTFFVVLVVKRLFCLLQEIYWAEKYEKLLQSWAKKLEKIENSSKRRYGS